MNEGLPRTGHMKKSTIRWLPERHSCLNDVRSRRQKLKRFGTMQNAKNDTKNQDYGILKNIKI
jgi:hypothetical protein